MSSLHGGKSLIDLISFNPAHRCHLNVQTVDATRRDGMVCFFLRNRSTNGHTGYS